MLPRYHIFFGLGFSLLIWIASPNMNPLFIILIFLSSFLIDFDLYMCSVLKTKKIGLFHAFEYHKELDKKRKKDKEEGVREKDDLHIFHTIEFHILVGILGLFWIGFFYIFIGMVFHSLLDIYSMLYEKEFYRREFFFSRWIYNKIK